MVNRKATVPKDANRERVMVTTSKPGKQSDSVWKSPRDCIEERDRNEIFNKGSNKYHENTEKRHHTRPSGFMAMVCCRGRWR